MYSASPLVAVRPPEYWPGVAYMALLDRADQVVLADTFQYSRQSFQNRARLRTPQGWQWISVPLQGRQHGTPIREVVIWQRPYWLRKHAKALMFNYRGTPYFEFYEPALMDLFEQTWPHLGALTCATVERLAELLRIRTPIVRASDLEGAPNTVADVLARVDASTLLADASQVDHEMDRVTATHGLHIEPPVYTQVFDGFEPGMSALDLLFNYGPAALGMLREAVQPMPSA